MTRRHPRGTITPITRKCGKRYQLRYKDEEGNKRKTTLHNPDGTPCTTMRDAEAARSGIIVEVERRLGLGLRAALNWEEAIGLFLKSWGPGVSTSHFEQVERSVRKFAKFSRKATPGEVSRQKVLAYQDERAAQNAGGTVNREIDHLKTFFGWMVNHEFLEASPVLHVKSKAEVQTRARRDFSNEELEKLWPHLRVLDAMHGGQPQEWVLFGLWALGCRWGALRLLQWRDVDLKTGTVNLRQGTTKGRRGKKNPRSIPLEESIAPGFVARAERARVLQGYTLSRAIMDTDPVFLSRKGLPLYRKTNVIMRFLNSALDHANIQKIDKDGERLVIHSLRSTWVTRLLMQGMEPIFVAKLAGHGSLDMVNRRYAKLNLERLRNKSAEISAPKWSPGNTNPPNISEDKKWG